MAKNWQLREAAPLKLEEELAAYPPLVRGLLFSRGISSATAADRFLNPNYQRDIHDPFLLKGMKEATTLILKTVRANEKIAIFADYDADGVPGAAILAEVFKKIGFVNFEVFIPDRQAKYGLSVAVVRELAAAGARVLITVDCGIADAAEVRMASELGIMAVITDHHLPPPVLPEAAAIVNPKQPEDQYPEKMLCGAAVAFKLAQAFLRTWDKTAGPDARVGFVVVGGWEKWFLDLVAIATVADMVPLTGENRALVYFGLKVLRRTRRLGLNSLFEISRLQREYLGEDDIGFALGPRLNAAGRMSHASEAYYLLTTESPEEAKALAEHLDLKNSERKKMVEFLLAEVDRRLLNQPLPSVVVLGSEEWNPAALGLAAGRLADRHCRPFFLWGKSSGGELKGSARSAGLVNLVELMRAAGGEELFSNFGGHAAAGGFTLRPEKKEEVKEKVVAAAASLLTETPPELTIDAELSLAEINDEFYRWLEKLSPFGRGNPKPTFLFSGLTIAGVRTFGNGGLHLELIFKGSDGQKISAVGFFAGNSGFGGVDLSLGRRIDLTAQIERPHLAYRRAGFRGNGNLRLRIVDLRPAV